MSLLQIVSSIASPASVNLTSKGTLDWAHWGLVDLNSFNHKSGITPQISNLIMLNGAIKDRWQDPLVWPACTWTDGTPTVSGSDVATELYSTELNQGFRITCPATSTTRTLTVYCKPYRSTLTYTASLSDSSASPVSTSITHATYVYQAIALNFNATGSDVTLSVDMLQTAESHWSGNIALIAATLEPLAGALGLTLNPSNPSQTVAQNSAMTPITVSVTGGTAPYTITATGLPPGVTLVQSLDQATISGAPSVEGDFIAFVTVTDNLTQVIYSTPWGMRVLPSARPKSIWFGRTP